MSTPESADLTPESAAPTDVAPLGRSQSKPPHERTADEEGAANTDWNAIAGTVEFKDLIKAKVRFILPATIFFVLYYFALPYLVGYQPQLMEKKVWGNVNVGYLFALSQFFMAWTIAGIYVFVAAGWDRRAAAILAKLVRK